MDYRALYDKVVEGRLKPLPAYIDMKAYADDLAITLEALKQEAISEFNNEWGGTEQVIHGALVAKHQSGRHSYDHDHTWTRIKEQLTMREKIMQLANKSNGPMLDEDTGEYVPPSRYTPSKESITIKSAAKK